MRRLIISRASAGFVRRGHPWVRPDRGTRGLAGLAAGEAVTLVAPDGERLASALADPDAPVCARVYADRPDRPFAPAAALARAWERRRSIDPGETDAYRLVHGEADGLPGLRIERYASVVVVLCTATCALPALPAILSGLADLLPGARVVIREHLADLRCTPIRTRLADGARPDPEELVPVRELGVPCLARPFAGLATGIYVDQRGTRRWLRGRGRDRRVLNLFAYTGLFSLSLLAAGAAEACDVDLSAPALALARRQVAAIGCASRHRTSRRDCRDFLRADPGRWDLIVCDPPTAAQGDRGWVLRRDYPDLLAACAAALAPGGTLLACRNTRGGRAFPLRRALGRCGLRVLPTAAGPRLEPDVPQRRGFPEGRPYALAVGVKQEEG